MSNSFNVQPLWIDTDTSTGANTNWRGSSGCTLAGIGSHGIKPTRILIVPVSGTVIAAGTIVVIDPQSSTVLLTIPIVLPAASEPFEIVQILVEQTATLWRDFVVAGLSSATKAALQIWYRTQTTVTGTVVLPVVIYNEGLVRELVRILSSVRVLLVEDFDPFRRFTRTTLQTELQIIAEVSDGLEAVNKAQELQPDLILLDIGLPGLNGIEAARRIRKLSPESKIIFVTQESSADVIEEAMNSGALGYVVKTQAASDLLAAVEAVREGRTFVSDGLAVTQQ
jgi:CheY-like chemotaxis protein